MKKHMIIAASVLATGMGAAAISSASAANEYSRMDQTTIKWLLGSKISITDAIMAAETMQAGKVAEAQFEVDKGMPKYKVSIIAPDGTEHDLMVDADTGEVAKLLVNEDRYGEDEDGDEFGETG